MTKPLIGGGAAAAALLSCSLLFLAQTSVAEPLGQVPQEVQQSGAAAQTQTTGAETTEVAVAADVKETNKAEAAAPGASKAAIDKTETGAEPEAETPAVTFTATAYSLRGRTASGRQVSRGIIAADRRVLPLGTRVRLDGGLLQRRIHRRRHGRRGARSQD